MSEFTERQIKELDIDWYCLIQGKPTHIASMGGMIPKKFHDRNVLRLHQDIVAGMASAFEVKVNLEIVQRQIADGYAYLEDRIIRDAIEDANRNNPGFIYLKDYELPLRLFASTFVKKARRGFRSFARIEEAGGDEYVLIAEPTKAIELSLNQLSLQELECELRDNGDSLMLKTK